MQTSDVVAAFRRVSRRFRLLASIGRQLIIDDSGPIQVLRVEGLVDEVRDDVPRMGQFGFASSPPEGTRHVLLAIGGNRENLVSVACEHGGKRRTLESPGSSGIYADAAAGSTEVVAWADGIVRALGAAGVEIEASGGAVSFTAGAASITLDPVAGVTISGPFVTINGINFLTHVHPDPVSGNSGPPQ